jgi:hypothetical protein
VNWPCSTRSPRRSSAPATDVQRSSPPQSGRTERLRRKDLQLATSRAPRQLRPAPAFTLARTSATASPGRRTELADAPCSRVSFISSLSVEVTKAPATLRTR